MSVIFVAGMIPSGVLIVNSSRVLGFSALQTSFTKVLLTTEPGLGHSLSAIT
jgi:hypothetical protein